MWTGTSSVPPDRATAGIAPLWWHPSSDVFDGQNIYRFDVAATGASSPVPPGVPHDPGPGRYYASPALAALLRSTPPDELADRYPGRLAGTIGDAALSSPNSLVIIIGRAPAQLARTPGSAQVTSIVAAVPGTFSDRNPGGLEYMPPSAGIQASGIDLILSVVALAMLAPVLIFIATATRLSAARREQRFAAMRLVGTLFDQSHESLRDLYEVSTPGVERLTKTIRSCPGVYGTRLMGGGFGGNVLALIRGENVDTVIDRVQSEYYGPQNRHGISEGSVMISTPGDGLAPINVESVWREAIEAFNSSGNGATRYRTGVNALLDTIGSDELPEEVWPVIVAAGKGTRSRASGLAIPKPLASILGTPAILHVLRNVRTAFSQTRRPIVIVSPETEDQIRALLKEDVTFVVQTEALGTGDAVLHAHEQMQGFHGRALVIWSTQPVIRPETMRRTLKLSALFAAYEMVLPTAHKVRPYAPLLRDVRGRVQTARETHLEQSEHLHFGEGNIGMFILKSDAMFKALIDLSQRHWNETERRYNRHGGELGFPNELINYFATHETGVFACPIADSREEQGIKSLADIAHCERFISELADQ